jgi:hypothetical protein
MNLTAIPSPAEERALIQVVQRIVQFALVSYREWRLQQSEGNEVMAGFARMSYRSYISAAGIAAERLRMRRFR